MALDTKLKGTTTGNGAEVNASNQVKVVLETDAAANPGNVGAARVFSENDAGSKTGTAMMRSPEVSQDYRTRVGIDNILFNEAFAYNVQNTNNWSYAFNQLTAAQPGAGSLNFSVVQGTNNANGAYMRTFQYFPVFGTAPLWHESTWGQFTAAMVANEVWSAGLGLPGGVTTLPTDGAWYQLTTAGLIGRCCFNGSFVDSGVLKPFAEFTVGTNFKAQILVGQQAVEWWMDDVLLGTTAIPAGVGQAFQSAALPAFFMKHCTGAVANTNTMRVFDLVITLADLQTNKPWAHQQALQGMSAQINQNGLTQGASNNWTNNTPPTAAAATTTAAIAGATASLGGIVAVLPTLAAGSDGVICSYQNPVPTINAPGRNLVITGWKVQGAVSVVLAGGPVVYQYGLLFGHTSASPATAETASFATGTTKRPRQLFIGMESYANNAAVGTIGQGCELKLDSPIVVRPGEFIAMVARNIGVVTTTGAITLGMTPIGYWD